MQLVARVRAFWRRIGPRLRDTVFFTVAVVAVLTEIVVSEPGDARDLPLAVHVVVGLASAATLWERRRIPAVVTVAGIAAFAITQWSPVVMCVGLFSLAVRRRDRTLAVMAFAVAATIALVMRLDGDNGWSEAIVVGGVVAAIVTLAGSYIGARRDLVDSLRERAQRAEQERELRTEQARLAERARIAREMHDVLAHKVSLIALHAGALEVNPSAGPAQVEQTAALVRSTAHEAMEDLREVLDVLRSGGSPADDDLAPPPRAADIERAVAASRAAGVQAELTMTVPELPDAVARSAYRIVREGLTNVHKHARGAATTVILTGDAGSGVSVEVVNDRPVSSAALLPGSGAGLLGLRERVALVGGTLDAGPSAEGGWRLRAWLPWHPGATIVDGAAS